jgi:hypothetical protein
MYYSFSEVIKGLVASQILGLTFCGSKFFKIHISGDNEMPVMTQGFVDPVFKDAHMIGAFVRVNVRVL